MALVYDGIQLLAETFKHIMFRPVSLNCNDDVTWDKGYTLVNYMKSVRGKVRNIRIKRTDCKCMSSLPSFLRKFAVEHNRLVGRY